MLCGVSCCRLAACDLWLPGLDFEICVCCWPQAVGPSDIIPPPVACSVTMHMTTAIAYSLFIASGTAATGASARHGALDTVWHALRRPQAETGPESIPCAQRLPRKRMLLTLVCIRSCRRSNYGLSHTRWAVTGPQHGQTCLNSLFCTAASGITTHAHLLLCPNMRAGCLTLTF